MFERQIFRPLSNLALAGTVFLLAALYPIEPLIRQNWLGFAAATAVSATAVALSWIAFVRPKLIIDDVKITIVNPFRTVVIPYGKIEIIDSKYSLVITTENGKFSCWVAPAPSRYGGRGVIKADIRNLPITSGQDSQIRASDSPKSHSGQAAVLVRMAVETFNRAAVNSDDKVTQHFNVVGATLTLALLLSAVALQLVH
ncbi:MAG: PH domain-containing protein [Micrococcales bacterium]